MFNTVFALFEILITNIRPLPWAHLPFLVVILGCYLGLAYLTYHAQHFFGSWNFLSYTLAIEIPTRLFLSYTVYNFFDPQTQHAKLAGWIVGIAIAEVVIFSIVHGVCIVRERLATRYFGKSTSSNGLETEKMEEWVTISEQGHDIVDVSWIVKNFILRILNYWIL